MEKPKQKLDIRRTPEDLKDYADAGYELFWLDEQAIMGDRTTVQGISVDRHGNHRLWSHSIADKEFYNRCPVLPEEEKNKVLEALCAFYNRTSVDDYEFTQWGERRVTC